MLVSNKHGLGAREGHLYGKGICLYGRLSVLGTAVDHCDARGLVLPEVVAVQRPSHGGQDVRATSRVRTVHLITTIDELKPRAWTIDPSRMGTEAHGSRL